MSDGVKSVSELGLTCGYPEWKRDDDMYPDWDRADECHNKAVSAILFVGTGQIWSQRCALHRTIMEHDNTEGVTFSDTIS